MNPKFKYGPDNAKTALALGKLERAAMESLWDNGEMSGSELFHKLGKKLGIRHNTLLTVLDRLVEKGLVEKRKNGRCNFFKPILSREEYCLKITAPILKELFNISSKSVLSAFVQNACKDMKQLEELKKLIDSMEKENHKIHRSKRSKE